MILICCSLIAMVLLLWFKTEVWYEYTCLLRLPRLSFAKAYEKEKLDDITITYIQFLRKHFRQYFIVRLVTCPICLSFWLSLILGILLWNIWWVAPIMIGSLILYGLILKLLDI